MTIQWVLIASFLYWELAVIVLFMLPFISSTVWKYILRFHLWEVVARKANTYFIVFLIVLILFFLDSIREMVKYSGKHSSHDYEAELQMHMKLFRSQRNYYIAGMAIFLSLVIYRLAALILTESDLIERNEESMKKAQESMQNLQNLTQKTKEVEVQTLPNEKFITELEKLSNELKNKENELKSVEQDMENLKIRNEQLSKDYKDLLEKMN
ncbi:b-cell receptor-associated protein 29 [Caerostris darwini]|uniref:Endoplasmic reticulum transmembrane protein n=1 Tax=Caerostris darwini TaxID=1538125 RepID=A0AAV4PU75_9ARAC|nr:b-cell receptor-associated protein 29 [Caerostris darwini]